MEKKLKTCGKCGLQKVMWKARTKEQPAMCKDCSNKFSNKTILKTVPESKFIRDKLNTPKRTDTLPELLKLAEIVFNRWIRKRDTYNDRTFKCISCDTWHPLSEMDAGHYISKKSSAVRFHEDNVHGQCKNCNQFLYGNTVAYLNNLITKIGNDRVKELIRLAEIPFKWDRSEVMEIINKYK